MSNELMSTSVIVGVEGTLIYSYIHFIGTYRICRVWLEQQLAAGGFQFALFGCKKHAQVK